MGWMGSLEDDNAGVWSIALSVVGARSAIELKTTSHRQAEPRGLSTVDHHDSDTQYLISVERRLIYGPNHTPPVYQSLSILLLRAGDHGQRACRLDHVCLQRSGDGPHLTGRRGSTILEWGGEG